jgi:uncharacterized protein (DUF952 family)
VIHHAALPADWTAARHAGVYTTSTRGRSLAEEGFIHAAYEWQIEGVANRFYADVDELVLLVIDVGKLRGARVLDEVPVGAPDEERFPHVYGPIPIGAVVETRSWRRRGDGRWNVADAG